MKIVTILGARPQFIKAATISRAIKKLAAGTELIVHTGQHYDSNMSDIFFTEMEIPSPHYSLGVQSKMHGEMTGKMLEGIESVLFKEKPNIVLVYGDTNSTLAGALAASKLHIPIAHVESGLRSFNKRMPEEINRILTDHISEWLFTPSKMARHNLIGEGINSRRIFDVGDVMYDASLYYREKALRESKVLAANNLMNKEFILVTIHRAENTDNLERFESIISQLNSLAKEITVVFPVHPRTRRILDGRNFPAGLRIIEPVGYLDMLALQNSCSLIVTDSGGIQKEAFFNKKYCITVRDETEWVELVDEGYNYLVKANNELLQKAKELLGKPFKKANVDLYGDGNAAEKIVNILSFNKAELKDPSR